MNNENITYLSVASLLVLMLPFLFVNYYIKLKLAKKLFIAILRMGVQLTLVGIYLFYIFEWNSIIVNLLYLMLMITISAITITKSSNIKTKAFLSPMFFAVLIPHIIILFYFNFFVAKITWIFDAKYIITIGGMLLGNTLHGNIIGLTTFYGDLKNKEKEYTYTLGLGASRLQAILPYLKNAIYKSINPTIASIATTGLVSLPGMMTGQILGGSVPMVAIKYQMAIMLAIFIMKYASVILSILFSLPKAFDNYDCLKHDIFVEPK